jgi:4,5-dihydroxyphthalate decarboxylase
MTNASELELRWEAQGSVPHYRFDHAQPLIQGRARIDGVKLLFDDVAQNAGLYENQRFQDGTFQLLDCNWGDTVPAIAAGWDFKLIPVFIKRKPVWNYLWVRSDRGIDTPRDLEGRTIGTVGYGSAISTYTRGFLEHFYDVDISKLHWLSSGPSRFPLHKEISVEYATGPRKSPVERLIDGEVDACTGDITDVKAWAALDAAPGVKLLFPDYMELNERLFVERQICTPVHMLAIGGKISREHPDLARRVYEGFERSRLIALDDALGDGTGYSMIVHMREQFREQVRTWGDVWRHGLAANTANVDTFLDYNSEQGLTKTRLSYEDVFALGTLDT